MDKEGLQMHEGTPEWIAAVIYTKLCFINPVKSHSVLEQTWSFSLGRPDVFHVICAYFQEPIEFFPLQHHNFLALRDHSQTTISYT